MVRYNVGRQDLSRARRPETVSTSRATDSRPTCPRCGVHTANPARRHTSPNGVSCKVPAAVRLEELPPVVMPPGRPSGLGRPAVVEEERTPGPRLWGPCEECGAGVSGERRLCGRCASRRPSGGRRS